MTHAGLADQLAEIRATLTRLKHRERQIHGMLLSAAPVDPVSRPGWPIQRAPCADHQCN